MSKNTKGEVSQGVTESTTEVTEAKVVRPTIAGTLDAAILAGGKWEDILATSLANMATLGLSYKVTKGYLKAHLNYRVKTQNKANFKALAVTDAGVNLPE